MSKRDEHGEAESPQKLSEGQRLDGVVAGRRGRRERGYWWPRAASHPSPSETGRHQH